MRILLISFMASVFSVSSFAAEKDPIQIFVSLKNQHLKVYQGTEQIAQSNISSGKRGHRSPTGVFSILQKNRHHRSNIYRNAPMPYMQRITWSGIALHSSRSVPRRPASHGCIRLPNKFARQLFKLKTKGAHVIIENEISAPAPISHSSLFQPIKSWNVNEVNDLWLKQHLSGLNENYIIPRHDLPVRIFITRRSSKDDPMEVQRLLDKIGYNIGEIDGIIGPQTLTAISRYKYVAGLEEGHKIDDAFLAALYKSASEQRPLNGRIMVRQRQRPLYSAYVTINNPEQALGSHLLSVTNFDGEAGKTDWLGVSLSDRIQHKIKLNNDAEVDFSTGRRDLHQVLNRISMDKQVREQISRLLTPGSSITISDNGFSRETHRQKGTDFIVLTKPQKNKKIQAKTKNTSNSG